MEAQRRGTVTVVNTLGSGILESPGLLRFLPELAERLLGEAPLLHTAPVYWGGIASERSHLLANLSSLLIKSTVGGKTLVGPTLSSERAGRAGRPHREHAVAVGRPGAAAVLVGAHRPRRCAVVGRRRHAVVHRRPTQRLRADDRRRRLRAGARARRVHAENRCGKRCLGAADGACAGRDGDACRRRERRRRPPRAPGASARRACCPTCSGWDATASARRTWPGC